MRFILHVTFPPEKFNEAVLDGTASQKMARILEEIRPEAAYFCTTEAKRGGFLVINMNSTSEMPKYAEPWFLNFDASVEFLPTMTPEDLQKAGLDDIGKKWR